MWSGPRNISTAMMRSFSGRADTFVTDEPFYAHYLNRTGLNHPGRDKIVQSYKTDYKKIINDLKGVIPNKKTIWYQKHMAHHIDPLDNLEWTNSVANCLLIRNPKHVIPSFLKKNILSDIYELGYHQQLKIFHFHNRQTPIVDAKDILVDPKGVLLKLCSYFKIEFEKEMLLWDKGPHPQDGIWGRYWYDKLWKSTTFSSYEENNLTIDKKYNHIVEDCVRIYDELYKYRIRMA
tara:strand:+ start:2181 stop:2882 length:702 start_codon:yes stop_codon:yes gene_type:complete